MILLDERLIKPLQDLDKELGRRRFTIAHECAHQMLYRMESEARQEELDLQYSARVFSLRELRSLNDWCEWQANALAAALLIPKKYVELLLGDRHLAVYGKRLNRPDKLALDNMCNRLKVSQTAMLLRLKQLGYLKVLPSAAYYDPTDVICDDECVKRGNAYA